MEQERPPPDCQGRKHASLPSPGGHLFKHATRLVVVLCLAFLAAAPAQGGGAKAGTCGVGSYSYAGLTSGTRARGISATLVPTRAPAVADGHVAGWVGVVGSGG